MSDAKTGDVTMFLLEESKEGLEGPEGAELSSEALNYWTYLWTNPDKHWELLKPQRSSCQILRTTQLWATLLPNSENNQIQSSAAAKYWARP